jgi:hypothetical protein
MIMQVLTHSGEIYNGGNLNAGQECRVSDA